MKLRTQTVIIGSHTSHKQEKKQRAPSSMQYIIPTVGESEKKILPVERHEMTKTQQVLFNVARSHITVPTAKTICHFSCDGGSISVKYCNSLAGPLKLMAPTNPTPAPRSGFSATALKTDLFAIFGGTIPVADLWLYRPSQNKWIHMKHVSPTLGTRHSHTTIYAQKRLYIFGGSNNVAVNNDVVILTIEDNHYSSRVIRADTNTPEARYMHTLTRTETGAYMFGGCDACGHLCSDLWELDITTNPLVPHWRMLKKNGPPGRKGHLAFIRDGAFFVAGGTGEKDKALNDVWRFDGNEWQQVGVFETSPSVFCTSVGICQLEENSSIKFIRESPTLAMRVDQFSELKDKQKVKMRKAQERLKNINALRMELAKIRDLKKEIETTQNCANAQEYFGQSITKALKREVESLRTTFVDRASTILDYHGKYFCEPPTQQEDLLDTWRKVLSNKLEYVKAKYTAKKEELMREQKLYNTLLDSAPTTSGDSDDHYENFLKFLSDVRRLERNRLKITAHRNKIVKVRAQISDNNEKLARVVEAIQVSEEILTENESQISALQSKINLLMDEIEKSRLNYEFVVGPVTDRNKILDIVRSRNDKYKQEYSQVLKDTFTQDERAALRSLTSLANLLYENSEMKGALATVQGQIRNCLSKLTAANSPCL